MKAIGTASFKDFDGLMCWYQALSLKEGRSLVEGIEKKVNELFPEYSRSTRTDTPAYLFKGRAKVMYSVEYWFNSDDWCAREWVETKQKTSDSLRQYQLFQEEYKQALNVGIWNEVFAYLYFGNPDCGIVVPTPDRYLTFTAFESTDDIPVIQIRAQLEAANAGTEAAILPASADGQLTVASLKKEQAARQVELDGMKSELERIQRGQTQELEALQAEIQKLQNQIFARKQELMAELEDKMGDMEEKMGQLEAQIYLLDSQIYAIRCLAGEVVKFAHIRVGRDAPATEPIVIHQKLRFLDEDLGRMASIYNIKWDQVGMFEEFLKHSPEALDTFAPNKRCVALVRVSKSNTRIGHSSMVPYSNLLQTYEYFHGRTVGIIIRNGDNLYFGWTDEDRVHIQDDFIISRITTEVAPTQEGKRAFVGEAEEKRWQREERKKARLEKMTAVDAIVSRAFVFNILQGVVNSTPWLPLPDGIKISQQSPYVRFALSDMCLEDHRFANFDQLVEMTEKDVVEGDQLLIMQSLRAYSGNHTHNDRGRGYADRTHDCHVEDGGIYPANLIEYSEPEEMVEVHREERFNGEDRSFSYVQSANYTLNSRETVIRRFTHRDRTIYISVEKTQSGDCFGDKKPRANFEIKLGEFINLTWMNSVWLSWAINTKNLGSWQLKGQKVEYAHAIRYLKIAMEHVREREAAEKKAIDAVDPKICENPDWPLMLSDWKFMLANDPEKRAVRTITPFQAKRFARWVNEGMPGRVNYGQAASEESATQN